MAMLATVALVATGCQWFVAEEGQTRLGVVDGEPLVFPMNVDVSDLADVAFFAGETDGQPFSWQCYTSLESQGASAAAPAPIAGLLVPVEVGAGDFLRVSVEWQTSGADVTSFCPFDPGFVPARQSNGLLVDPGAWSHCEVGVLVNGTPQEAFSSQSQAGREKLELQLGPLTGGNLNIEFASIDCTGRQWNAGDLRLVVEHIEATSSGSVPWTGTTIPTPTTSFDTGTTTTLAPVVPECPPNAANPVLRADMAFMLWRLAGMPTGLPPTPFTDIPPGAFYEPAVRYVYDFGITTGTSPTAFSPNATVTRGQYVTFAHRYAGSPAAAAVPSYTDVSESAYYFEAVRWAFETGAMAGTSPTTFEPNSPTTHDTAEDVALYFDPSFTYFDCPT